VRFGLFYEHQLPRPWEDGAEERLLRDALDQVELADRVGFHSVWEVEHHFLEEYSHSSAPEVFLAAASQRTERIRLGHGIVQLPPAFNHPARIAERIATLDLLSGGRVEFGTGEASSQAELGGFGVDRESKRAQWEEALDVVTRLLVEEPFAGHHGRFLDLPPRNLVPKPRQRPHPPLWIACSRRDTILVAAEKGLGALSFSFVEPEQAREWVEEYYRIVASPDCVAAGFAVNPNVAVVVPFMVHDDEATAIELGIDGAHFFGYSLAHYYVFGEHRPGRTNVWEEFRARRDEVGFAREIVTADQAPLGVRLLQQGLGSLRGAIGTPGQVRDLMARYREAGVDEVILVGQAGRNRHEDICASIELFGAEVLPEFEETREAEEAAKRDRLAEACAQAVARRPPRPRADAAYVISPQGEPAPARPAVASLRGGAGTPLTDRPASGTPGRGNGGLASRLAGALSGARARLERRTELRFATWVRGRSDAQLERALGRNASLRPLFWAMARRFRPDRAAGFSGDVQYVLASNGRAFPWMVRIRGEHVTARPERSPDPAVTISMGVPTFARVAAGELLAPRALLDGRIDVEGDLGLAARLGPMFGQADGF
jgi:alkanesulfonate monooxygenase SsuD/methylene tetrahydromethanopterin reductase-like flavin-dependent oxidoreductase (luciferase family)